MIALSNRVRAGREQGVLESPDRGHQSAAGLSAACGQSRRRSPLRPNRLASPERSPLRQSRPVRHTVKRAVEIVEGATSPDAARSPAVPSMTALTRNRGALMFSATCRDRDHLRPRIPCSLKGPGSCFGGLPGRCLTRFHSQMCTPEWANLFKGPRRAGGARSANTRSGRTSTGDCNGDQPTAGCGTVQGLGGRGMATRPRAPDSRDPRRASDEGAGARGRHVSDFAQGRVRRCRSAEGDPWPAFRHVRGGH